MIKTKPLPQRYKIVATDEQTGKQFLCFTWTRDAASGIARAKFESVRFNRPISDVVAIPVH